MTIAPAIIAQLAEDLFVEQVCCGGHYGSLELVSIVAAWDDVEWSQVDVDGQLRFTEVDRIAFLTELLALAKAETEVDA